MNFIRLSTPLTVAALPNISTSSPVFRCERAANAQIFGLQSRSLAIRSFRTFLGQSVRSTVQTLPATFSSRASNVFLTEKSSPSPQCVVMEGHSLADDILDDIKIRVENVRELIGRPPRLAVLFVGERADSQKYIRVKSKTANAVGIETIVHHLPKTSSLEEVLKKVNELNIDSGVDGIIIQLPLPGHINAQIALQTVTPSKDVDGFHLHNQANLLDSDYVNTCAFTFIPESPVTTLSATAGNDLVGQTQNAPVEMSTAASTSSTTDFPERLNWNPQRPGSSTEFCSSDQALTIATAFPDIVSNLAVSFKGATGFLMGAGGRDFTPVGQPSPLFPCTPLACIALLDRYHVSLPGAHVVVLGRSTVVGFPLSMMLMHRGAVVSNLDSHARLETMKLLCQNADVIVTAVGHANLVTPDLVKPGAVILDVGINFVSAEVSVTKRDEVNAKDIPGTVSNPIGTVFPATHIPKRRYDCADKATIARNTEGMEAEMGAEVRIQQSAIEEGKKLKKLVGDVAFEECFKIAGKVTPVPGGLGPVTVAMLLRNLVSTCEHSASRLSPQSSTQTKE